MSQKITIEELQDKLVKLNEEAKSIQAQADADKRELTEEESRQVEAIFATFEATEKLGAFTAHKVRLEAREGVDVAYPVVRLWIDAASANVLKSQELALSGRLMRTALYPRWKKV